MCGILLLNIIAFLLYMVMRIVRLHEPRYIPDENDGFVYRYITRHTAVWFVIGFNVVLLTALAVCAEKIGNI